MQGLIELKILQQQEAAAAAAKRRQASQVENLVMTQYIRLLPIVLSVLERSGNISPSLVLGAPTGSCNLESRGLILLAGQ